MTEATLGMTEATLGMTEATLGMTLLRSQRSYRAIECSRR
jgi:hypothetical protein